MFVLFCLLLLLLRLFIFIVVENRICIVCPKFPDRNEVKPERHVKQPHVLPRNPQTRPAERFFGSPVDCARQRANDRVLRQKCFVANVRQVLRRVLEDECSEDQRQRKDQRQQDVPDRGRKRLDEPRLCHQFCKLHLYPKCRPLGPTQDRVAVACWLCAEHQVSQRFSFKLASHALEHSRLHRHFRNLMSVAEIRVLGPELLGTDVLVSKVTFLAPLLDEECHWIGHVRRVAQTWVVFHMLELQVGKDFRAV